MIVGLTCENVQKFYIAYNLVQYASVLKSVTLRYAHHIEISTKMISDLDEIDTS